MTTPWFPDELAHAGPEHLDEAFIAGYDRKQGNPDAAEDLAALRERGVDGTATVVDLAAGTGQFTVPAAAAFARVVAVDVSAPMLGHLRRRLEAEGHPQVECVRAGFLSYTHQGFPADAVHTRHALHQLPDFWKAVALDRIARTLRPGGVLRLRDLVFDCRPSEVEEVVRHWLESAADDPADGYTAEDYAEHLRTEHSTFRWLLEPLLEAAGFEIVRAGFHGSLYGAYTCVKRPS